MIHLDVLRLKDIFDHLSDGIFILDREWRIEAMNTAAERISKWKRGDVESLRLCTEIFLCFDREGNQLCENGCPKQSVMVTGDPSNELDVKVMTKTGQSVILPGSAVLIPTTDETDYVAIIVKDEIEKQLLEERLLSGERLDPLTQLYHRQYFEELFNIEAKRAQRHGGDITILMLDVAGLRNINAQHGNRTGDEVLKGIGKVIKKTIREVDVAGRYGDDEYVILLYGIDESRARSFIQRLQDNIRKWNKTNKIPQDVQLNMCLVVSDREFDTLLAKAKSILDKHEGETL